MIVSNSTIIASPGLPLAIKSAAIPARGLKNVVAVNICKPGKPIIPGDGWR